MLKVCLNGGRSRREHPAVPVTGAELAADAVACVASGVTAIHLHPRDHDGAETLAATFVAESVAAVRAACPGTPIGISTGAWIVPEPAARVAAVRSWVTLPDFASVNAHEPGAEAVAMALHERGIGVEAGLWTPDAVAAYRRWRVPVHRVLLECLRPDPDGATAQAEELLAALRAGGPDAAADTQPADTQPADTQPADTQPADTDTADTDTAEPAETGTGAAAEPEPPVLLHAEGPGTWPVLALAVRYGLHTRIGLEDTAELPDGSPAPDNLALVAAAVALGAR
ncbi:3-keto-5-aminohexanoate cleavage protein [Plantactinospora sp. KBS50]|uniref:3-keto-5-aminohexanoate cleavage protein n=1 Tax=Plantactinospora sp. KBS50 TaxID=2024580 RepID=UPI000BAAB26E|nr:3-keto-5-aminohexanoate cleavage protein [Plantactinospora sp. KBS50]ASW54119.1 hypothetical protein CIK06_07825 [Plantactinospora sp. KBS50]